MDSVCTNGKNSPPVAFYFPDSVAESDTIVSCFKTT